MNHGDHSGHQMSGEAPIVPRCSMNMLWYVPLHNSGMHASLILLLYNRNTQIEHTCIVFRSWHIYTMHAFVFSCIAIVALGVLYEWLREAQTIADRRIAATLSAQGKGKGRTDAPVSGRSSPGFDHEETGLLTGLPAVKEPRE